MVKDFFRRKILIVMMAEGGRKEQRQKYAKYAKPKAL
jgi:hypothetical protein